MCNSNKFLFTYGTKVTVKSGFFYGLKGKVTDIEFVSGLVSTVFDKIKYRYLVQINKNHKEWIWEDNLTCLRGHNASSK